MQIYFSNRYKVVHVATRVYRHTSRDIALRLKVKLVWISKQTPREDNEQAARCLLRQLCCYPMGLSCCVCKCVKRCVCVQPDGLNTFFWIASHWPVLLQDLVVLVFLMHGHEQITQDAHRWVTTMWLMALITANTSWVYVIAPARYTHRYTLIEGTGNGARLRLSQRERERSRIEDVGNYKCQHKTWEMNVSACMCDSNREHVRRRRREIWRSEWKSPEPAVFRHPAGITFSSLHLLLHTHTNTHTRAHTQTSARWLGKHNQGGCCCCFKASQRVHKLS